MILGWASYGHKGVIYPLLVRAIGVIASIIGTYAVKTKEEVRNAMKAINVGFLISAFVSIVGFMVIGWFYLRFPEGTYSGLPVWATFGVPGLDLRPAWTTLIGIILAVAINRLTEYFTDTNKPPVKSVAESCQTGHATTIITGFAVGLESTVWAILVISVAILISAFVYAGANPTFIAYGVSMAGIGMLTLTGNNISMDVFGPVADNANGIGEMAKLPKEARQILADLDAVGNTTKAITKGIAIASAVVAAISLFNAYITDISNITGLSYARIASTLSISDHNVFVGLLIGGAIPFLFSSLTIKAVGRAAFLIVKEVRDQFKDKEIWEGKKTPDYAKVVSLCTTAAQKELIRPGLLAILAPLVVGLLLKKEALGGFLAGMILSGQLLAVFMANAGGAWDNAKKLIEDGIFGGKGSEAHKASVTGDTVGDPLKDTAGPALNPLIKVMNMVALLAIPLVVRYENSPKVFWAAVVVAFGLLALVLYKPKPSKEELALIEKA
jgi:K(+)-stimulated pyrophosphate-energized sodium pump